MTGEIGQCVSDDNGFSVESRNLALRFPDKSERRFRLRDLSFHDDQAGYLSANGDVMNG